MSRRFVALALAAALVAASCGDDEGDAASSTTTTTIPSSTTVSTTVPSTTTVPAATVPPTDGCAAEPTDTRTFVDETRVTPATAESEELPSRTLDVWIDAPAEPGPWPLIVFNHGLTGHPRNHEQHRRHMAEACFVVVAPAFPLTNQDVPGGFMNAGDTAGQVGDVSFLIDEVLADPGLAAMVDAQRIGVMGHSLGGLTTAGAGLAEGGDERISAVAIISAGFGQARDGVAVLAIHGDGDQVVPIVSSTVSFELVAGRGMLVTLLGGDHIAGIIDDDSDYGRVVRAVSAAFFAEELDNLPATVDALSDVDVASAAIEARTADGPLGDWRDYFA